MRNEWNFVARLGSACPRYRVDEVAIVAIVEGVERAIAPRDRTALLATQAESRMPRPLPLQRRGSRSTRLRSA